jgi:hypothetical protein
VGVPAGLLYTKVVLAGLSTVWREAAGLPTLTLHVGRGTLLLGGALGTGASLGGLLFVLRGQLRLQTHALLAGVVKRPDGKRSRAIAIVLVVVAVATLVLFGRKQGVQNAEVFFGAGSLFLIAGFFGADAFLLFAARAQTQARSFASLALSAAARRRRRSLTTIALIASGAFLVVGVGGGRSDPQAGADRRASGTGGFALVAESARPIARDLNSPAARPQIGLDAQLPASFVSFRIHEGDDASCRSPGRPISPRLYGVAPKELLDRMAFTFSAAGPWARLEESLPDGAVPAVGDEGTVVWSLHLGMGETLETTDENGLPLRLRIVGITATSILQGGLVLSEEQFLKHFPGDGGYRLFLVDAAGAEAPAVSSALTEALRDEGLRVMPAWQRLASFQSVENTYLAIFQTLGALGLLLGCLGVAILVLRHALERRTELAVLEAVGFTRGQVRWLFVSEHALLVLMGLANGVFAALICLLPMLRLRGSTVPVGALAVDLLLITVTSLAAATGATWFALRGPLARSLQSEN